MPEFELAIVDYAIVAVYIAGIFGIAIYVGRKKQDVDDFFLGGRIAVFPIIGFALMAANLSGTSYIGLAGAGYAEGISVWNYEWMATLVLIAFAFLVLPFYIRSKVSTVPEFLEKRYDRRSRTLFSAFTVFTAVFIDSAGALFAGAITLELLFPDVPLWTLVVAVAVLGGIYVIIGGLQAVMITDTIQGVLLLVAGGIIFFFVWNELDFSWSAIRDVAPEDGFTIAPPPDDDFLPWPGIFTGVIWLGIYYWMTNHVVVQKALAARSLDHARWGVLFCAFLQLPLLFLLILPGTMGRGVFPDIEDPDQIWQALAFDYLPIGVRGLVLAALVAALMSTLDSVLNGAASLVTNDFVRTRRPDTDERKLLIIGRFLVGGFMILAAVWGPQIARFPTIVEYFQSFLGQITMPVITVLLGGILWKRATNAAAVLTLAIGLPVGLGVFVTNELFELYEIQFLYTTGMMLAFSLLLFVGISLATEPRPADELEEVTFNRAKWREESEELSGKPVWQNYRYIGIALAVLTIVLLIPFI